MFPDRSGKTRQFHGSFFQARPESSQSDTSPLSEITADRGSPRVSLEAEEIKEALAGHVDAALLAPTSPRKVPEWLLALKDALAAKCCVGDASGERGAAQ